MKSRRFRRLAPALAQVPPAVPALPDTERRTSYSISGTTCACAVNFALYGDSTDYQNWVEVFINGVRVNARDGAAIRNEARLTVTALEDSELVLVDAA